MENNLMVFENKNVEVFNYEGKVLFNPKHVASILDIKNVNDNVRKMNDKQVIKLRNSNISDIKFRKLHNTGELFLTESGVAYLVSTARFVNYDKKLNILKALNINIEQALPKCNLETEFIDMLEDTLKPMNIKGVRQYSLFGGKYRIDYYIPELKLAIEYDEDQHFKKDNIIKDDIRQVEIEKELGCIFIRCNYRNTNTYNIGLVVKYILENTYNKVA